MNNLKLISFKYTDISLGIYCDCLLCGTSIIIDKYLDGEVDLDWICDCDYWLDYEIDHEI